MTDHHVRRFVARSLARAAIFFAALLLAGGPGFAAPKGEPPRSVLPPKHTTEPQPQETGDGQIEVVDQYEKDPSVEKVSIGAVIQANWHEDAAYVNRDPSADGPGYSQWDFDIEYGGHFTTRIYKIPQILQPAKLVIPKTSFTLYAKKITGSAAVQDKHSRTVSTDVNVVPSLSIVTGQAKLPSNPLASFDDFFQLDLALSGGVATPMAGSVPMAGMTPFMAIMRPQGALEMAGMNPAQVLLNPTALMDKMKTTYFKLPIVIDGFSINQLKKGSVTKHISDRAAGPGLMGTIPHTSGQLNCAVDISVTLYLKNAAGGGYDPNKKEPGPYVPEGPGTGGPGVVRPPGRSDQGTKPPADEKRPATLLNGRNSDAQNNGDSSPVLAKAIRILYRALRDMGIQKTAGDFMGTDYQDLTPARKRGLLYYFIDEAKRERVTILKGAPFYVGKLDAAYGPSPALLSQLFVNTLTGLILGENDWTE